MKPFLGLTLVAVLIGFSLSCFASQKLPLECDQSLSSLNESERTFLRPLRWEDHASTVYGSLNEHSWDLQALLPRPREQKIREILGRARTHTATPEELKAVASYFVGRTLWEARFSNLPAEGAMTLQGIHSHPESVFPRGFEPTPQLAAAVKELVPAETVARAKLASGLATDLDVEVQQAIAQGPQARLALLKRFLERGDIAESRMDRLTGLDDERIRDDDLKHAPRKPMKDEKVYLSDGHSFYGSGYGGFSAYEATLNIPKGGTVCDLGAGPFLAAANYGALRPDVTVVGYELLPARVQAGRALVETLGLKDRARLHEANLSDPNLQLELADGYVLMNPFPKKASTNLVRMLKEAVQRKGTPVRVVVYDQAQETLSLMRLDPKAFRKIAYTPVGENSKYGFYTFELSP